MYSQSASYTYFLELKGIFEKWQMRFSPKWWESWCHSRSGGCQPSFPLIHKESITVWHSHSVSQCQEVPLGIWSVVFHSAYSSSKSFLSIACLQKYVLPNVRNFVWKGKPSVEQDQFSKNLVNLLHTKMKSGEKNTLTASPSSAA